MNQVISMAGVVLGRYKYVSVAVLICLGNNAHAQFVTMNEDVKILGSDASNSVGASFGWSSAISGDDVIVGGHTNGDAGKHSGSAYIFNRNQGGLDNWGEVIKLTAQDAAEGDQYGMSVSIDGDIAVVGSFHDDDACVNEPSCESGSVYIYRRDLGGPDAWGLVKKIVPLETEAGMQFGFAVGISGDTLIATANKGFNGIGSGSAYIFQRDQGGANNWGQVERLISSDASSGDEFGSSVAIDGDFAIVGTRLGVFPQYTGAAYVFDRNQGGPDNWGEIKRLIASDADSNDEFGFSVAISGDTAIVGAHRNDDAVVRHGSAYIFSRDSGGTGNWGEVVRLISPDFTADRFGVSVAIDGGVAVVGDWWYDQNGFTNRSGSAYVFLQDEGGPDNWGGVYRMYPAGVSAVVQEDVFGRSVGVSGSTVIGGASASNEFGTFTGSAYLFHLELPCLADLNSDGELDFFDVSVFLMMFGAMDPSVDFNQDMQFDFFDVSLFLQAFLAGCP